MANGEDVVFCRGTGQSDDSDIWDDTALIKAYDKAVASFKSALKGESNVTPQEKENPGKKRKNNKKSKTRKRSNTEPDKEWQVGNSCYAFWSEDGNLYAATISSIDQEKGTCLVIYTDYGNEEEHKISDLLTEGSDLDEDALKTTDTIEAESSTESDRSFTPHQSGPQKHKSRGRSPMGPPSWVPGFPPGLPPGPPPGPHFHKTDGRRSESPGHFLPGWPPMIPPCPPMIPPPPPPMSPDALEDDEALGSMLISWYMSGYHTGYYLGLKQGRREAAASKKSHRK